MATLILHLQAYLLLFGFVFTESSDTLQCFNDYDTELKCTLTLSEYGNCSEYRLEALIYNKERFCRFEETHIGACECRIPRLRFVVTEMLKIKVLKGDTVVRTEMIKTEESIKPRRPIITSVVQKANGDIKVSVNTTYTEKPFSDSLVVELTYNIDASDKNTTMFFKVGSTDEEILRRNLQPNSRYVLRARVKSTYPPNKTFSEYSEAYKFETPLSLQNIFQILIPILCIILIICISSIYFWFNRIVKPWWDEIPTPKFSTHFVKQVPQLLSLQTEFSSVNLDSTANYINKKICMESCGVQDEDHHYGLIPDRGVDSAPLIYSTACYETVRENVCEKVESECEKDDGLSLTEHVFENKSYWQTSSRSTPPPTADVEFTNVPSENFQVSPQSLDPTIYMDVDYCMWNGCSDSGTSNLLHIMPINTKTGVVFGYPSISWSDPILGEPFSAKKLQDVPFPVQDRIVIPADEEYQAF